MFKNKKLIIFDMDGTLIDSVGIWNEVDRLLIAQIRQDGKPEDENYQQQRDEMLRQFAKARNPYMEYCAFLKEKYCSSLTAEEIHSRRYAIAQGYLRHSVDYKPDADSLIKKLKAKGFMLAIASTTRGENMNIYRKQNQNIMEKAALDEYFTLIYTREDAKEIKPHPEVFLKVLQALNVPAEESLVFEDSLIGVEAAKTAGLEVAVLYDKYSDADRGKINQLADHSFNGFDEIITLL